MTAKFDDDTRASLVRVQRLLWAEGRQLDQLAAHQEPFGDEHAATIAVQNQLDKWAAELETALTS